MAIPFLIVRVDELPAFPVANAMYIVKDKTRPDKANVVFTGKTTQDSASLLTFDDIDTIVVDKITEALQTNQNIQVFQTYADMMGVVPQFNTFAYVKDNTGGLGDPDGPASYIYEVATDSWTPVSSGTSEVRWNSIMGRPTATPSQIDQAVSMAHSHPNQAVLDKLSSNPEGLLTFDGQAVSNVVLTTTDW
jgi:hypothetical protein